MSPSEMSILSTLADNLRLRVAALQSVESDPEARATLVLIGYHLGLAVVRLRALLADAAVNS